MKVKQFFKKLNSNVGDKYVYLVVGIIGVIISILIYLNLFDFTTKEGEPVEQNREYLIATIFLVLSIIGIIGGIMMIKRDKIIFQKSVYYKILDDYKNNKIKNKFLLVDLDPKFLKITENNDSLYIQYNVKDGYFEAYIDKLSVTLSYDFTDEYWDNYPLDNNDGNPILDKYEELKSLDLSNDDFYNKFASFIKENESLL